MLRKKKYILVAASVALSAGLLANASGCSAQEGPPPERYNEWTTVINPEGTYDIGLYKTCDGSTLVYFMSQSYNTRSGGGVVPNSPECAK